MFSTITPLVLDSSSSGLAAQATVLAAPIWDIGANFKNKGIGFAIAILIGGTALVAAWSYFVSKDKTVALKAIAIGVVLIGVVASLPSLGIVSKDTVGGLTNSGGFR